MTDLLTRRDATISTDGKLRWTLSRNWGPGRTVCYIGHNPSTAGKEVEDPTTLAWQHFARVNGFDQYVAVNLYPFRSPDPAACRTWADWENSGPDWYVRDTIHENLRIVIQQAKLAAAVVACWGTLVRDQFLVDHLVEEIQSGFAPYPDIQCLGLTAAGDPKHPMARGKHRVQRDQRFIVWRAARIEVAA